MARNILLNEFNRSFKKGDVIETKEIRGWYKANINGIKDSTVSWNIYHLMMNGVIHRERKGFYKKL